MTCDVTEPHNPDFHWGHCLFVTDEDAVDAAGRWVMTFHSAFPEANWVAIGLPRMPDDQDAWVAQGLDLELDEVLTTRALPRQVPLPKEYAVRRLSGDHWAQCVARRVVENGRTGGHDQQSFERFAQGQVRARRALSEQDRGLLPRSRMRCSSPTWASSGAVRRRVNQSVGTDDDHRRRGLASHLLGVAARWSANRGCERWVIVTEATNPAGRVQSSVGFEPDTGNAQAYRKPPRSARLHP